MPAVAWSLKVEGSLSSPTPPAMGAIVQLGKLGTIRVALTDFDRTLTRLFDRPWRERAVCADLLDFYRCEGLPVAALLDEVDPYALWAKAYDWMREHLEPTQREALNQRAAAHLTAHEVEAAGSARLLEGVEDTLCWLSIEGFRILIVSSNSSTAIWCALRATGVAELFDHVFGRDDGFRMDDLKPNTTYLEAALEAADSVAQQAFFAGDSPTDMTAGRKAGVLAIGVATGTATRKQLLEAGADHCIDSFAGLRDFQFS